MEIELRAGEPWLRVRVVVDWREEHTILRVQNRIAFRAEHALFGQPHGTLARTLYPATPEDRAKFEVAGQRFASIANDDRGVAVFTTDLYGWNALGTDTGADLGLSLLRSPLWPDPTADRGETVLEYAFVPHDAAPVSALEAAWREYALAPRVRLFEPDDDNVLVVATKVADDGDGVIVRVRECDGRAGEVRVRCGGRAREALAVDGCERALGGNATIDEERLVFTLPAFGLRAFRVRF
jgi:alpha-mannosidase